MFDVFCILMHIPVPGCANDNWQHIEPTHRLSFGFLPWWVKSLPIGRAKADEASIQVFWCSLAMLKLLSRRMLYLQIYGIATVDYPRSILPLPLKRRIEPTLCVHL